MVESQCHQKKMAGNHAGRYPCACPNKDNNTKKAPLPRYKNVFPERSAADGAAYGPKPILHWRKVPLTCENTEVVSNGPDLNQTLLDDGSRHCCYRKKKILKIKMVLKIMNIVFHIVLIYKRNVKHINKILLIMI